MDASGKTKKNSVTKRPPGKQATQERAELFAQLVCENKRAVFAVALAKLRNPHDAEDVMQEVFVEAYRNFHKLRNPHNIGAWLHKATIYRCKDHFRKKSRREKRERIFAETVQDNPSTGASAETGGNDAVLEAIELLPEKYRHVLLLKHFAMLSYNEISEMTGLSAAAIGNRLQAARKKLQGKLTEMGEGVD